MKIYSTYSEFQNKLKKRARNAKIALGGLAAILFLTGVNSLNDQLDKKFKENLDLISRVEQKALYHDDKMSLAVKLGRGELAFKNYILIPAKDTDGAYVFIHDDENHHSIDFISADALKGYIKKNS